jgi:ArsR family transcriptional regulator
MEMLETSPRCVGELTEAIGADITTVSKHLSVMKRAGLVRDEKRGTYSYYSLACDCVTQLLDCVERGMEPRAGVHAPGTGGRKRRTACKVPR